MKGYTAKEIADLLEVSKPTVQKVINDLGVEYSTKGKRDRLYPAESVVKIIQAISPSFDVSDFFEKIENTENEPEKPQNNNEKTAKTENDNEREWQSMLIQTLQQQIEDQRKQLESKDKEITDLHRLLDQQQVLTLQANQKIELLEHTPEEEYERSWFGLYRRKKK